jgi:hypothetical protein
VSALYTNSRAGWVAVKCILSIERIVYFIRAQYMAAGYCCAGVTHFFSHG